MSGRRDALTRQRVVDVAAELADAEGLEALSLARVAAALGVRSPSLYNHVGGLDDLLDALALRGLERYAGAMVAATVGRARGDAVRGLAVASRALAAQHPGLWAAMQRTREGQPGPVRDAQRRAVDLASAVLSGYALAGAEAIHAARLLRSAVHGFVSLERAGGFGLPADVDASFDRLVEAVVAALEAWEGRAR